MSERTPHDGKVVASRTWGYSVSNNKFRKSAHRNLKKLTRRFRKALGLKEIALQLDEMDEHG